MSDPQKFITDVATNLDWLRLGVDECGSVICTYPLGDCVIQWHEHVAYGDEVQLILKVTSYDVLGRATLVGVWLSDMWDIGDVASAPDFLNAYGDLA